MVKANEFITESIDAVNELDLYINNNEDLYRKHFMPIVYNLQRKLDKKIYDHEKAKKLWMYLVDTAAREYTQEFGQPGEDVKDFFPKPTREKVAQVLADRELKNLEQGEYNVAKRTIS
jgi:hypothetical protein